MPVKKAPSNCDGAFALSFFQPVDGPGDVGLQGGIRGGDAAQGADDVVAAVAGVVPSERLYGCCSQLQVGSLIGGDAQEVVDHLWLRMVAIGQDGAATGGDLQTVVGQLFPVGTEMAVDGFH